MKNRCRQGILRIGPVAVVMAASAFYAAAASGADGQQAGAEASVDQDLAQQIFDTLVQAGAKPGYRVVHAKGIVCKGAFVPSKGAAALSRAAHFRRASVPVTVRFSNAAADPATPDNSPDAGARGMAIRFALPGGGRTDIVALSHNGFAVGTGKDFLALRKAIAATEPSKPHPWPVEAFLAGHPLAAKFVKETQVIPASYGTHGYFSNDAFIFVNKEGVKQAGRYEILPVAGQQDLSEAEAKTKSANFLAEDLRTRLKAGPIKFRLVVQLPNPGDPTNDSSLVWPEDRKTIEVGTISITSVVADSDAAQRALAVAPTNLTDGIELSDDPLPALRTSVYGRSVARRRQK
ncbi:MAG TPA: catalase family peroxidase [Polyangia bacterium]|nr:catalase family peroxidase [Polyangia bacterium]